MPAPRGLIQPFDQHLHRSRLLAPGQKLLVACSGGPDSVALLLLLHAVNAADHWHFGLCVAHVNHRIRGPACDEDQGFTRALAGRLGLAYLSRTLTLQPSGRGVISENTSRRARYAALAEMATETGCTAVVTAHHADDQAETVLMRMLRGSSVRGLRGIAGRTRLGSLTVIRPLLPFSKVELRAHLALIGEAACEDRTNQSPEFLRNNVRHRVLPLLESLQPAVRRSLGRLAEQARDADSAIGRETRALMPKAVAWEADRQALTIRREPLRAASLAAVGRLLRDVLGELHVPVDRLHYETVRAAARALRNGRASLRVQFPNHVFLRVYRDHATVGQQLATPRGKKSA